MARGGRGRGLDPYLELMLGGFRSLDPSREELRRRDRSQSALESPFVRGLIEQSMREPDAELEMQRPDMPAAANEAAGRFDERLRPKSPPPFEVPVPREAFPSPRMEMTVGEPFGFKRAGRPEGPQSAPMSMPSQFEETIEVIGTPMEQVQGRSKAAPSRLQAPPQAATQRGQRFPRTEEEFEMFRQILPQLTQREVVRESARGRKDTARIQSETSERNAVLRAGVELSKELNKQYLQAAQLRFKAFALAQKPKKSSGDLKQLADLAKQAEKAAHDAEGIMSQQSIAAMWASRPGSPELAQVQSMDAQAKAARQEADAIYSLYRDAALGGSQGGREGGGGAGPGPGKPPPSPRAKGAGSGRHGTLADGTSGTMYEDGTWVPD